MTQPDGAPISQIKSSGLKTTSFQMLVLNEMWEELSLSDSKTEYLNLGFSFIDSVFS
jgi:hypothetical protein